MSPRYRGEVMTTLLAYLHSPDRGVWMLGPWQIHPLVLLFVASGTLMVSKTLRIPKL